MSPARIENPRIVSINEGKKAVLLLDTAVEKIEVTSTKGKSTLEVKLPDRRIIGDLKAVFFRGQVFTSERDRNEIEINLGEKALDISNKGITIKKIEGTEDGFVFNSIEPVASMIEYNAGQILVTRSGVTLTALCGEWR